MIYEQILTTDAIYLTMYYGNRVKIYWNASIGWAKDYGDIANSMALSADSSYLITDSFALS